MADFTAGLALGTAGTMRPFTTGISFGMTAGFDRAGGANAALTSGLESVGGGGARWEVDDGTGVGLVLGSLTVAVGLSSGFSEASGSALTGTVGPGV